MKTKEERTRQMILLQYHDGKCWTTTGKWDHEVMAWMSLGGDDVNYRTIDCDGNVLTDKSVEIVNKGNDK